MRKRKAGKRAGRLFALAVLAGAVSGCAGQREQRNTEQLAIYLYSDQAREVEICLEDVEENSCTYPEYEEKWNVIARADGRLTNLQDGQEYSCLFLEEDTDRTADLGKGFVVRGEDTGAFLQKTLSEAGLLPAEYNTCILQWLPRMEKNPWNLIILSVETERKTAGFRVTPEPDSVLCVSLAYQGLEEPVEVEEPELEKLRLPRQGFTLVQWRGMELPQA